MAMRTARAVSGMSGFGEAELDPCPHSRGGVDAQIGADDAGPFLDDHRTEPPFLELDGREPSFEVEAPPIVFDHELVAALLATEPDEDVARATVLSDIDERLLQDADDFERVDGP